jgi:hypothetical protein
MTEPILVRPSSHEVQEAEVAKTTQAETVVAEPILKRRRGPQESPLVSEPMVSAR